MNKLSFVIKSDKIVECILIPKYYDPHIPKKLNQLKKTHDLTSFESLKENGTISVSTGDEIGKMSYGTGDIPFVRTSDISNWEIKFDPKQGISEEIYNEYRDKQDVRAGDILLVRDGTYLVGNTCMLTKNNSKILYQSHILKIRVERKNALSPYLLLAVLNCPIVVEQMKAKRFTADIIDTLGKRIDEVVLPIPVDKKIRDEIITRTDNVISVRSEFKNRVKKTVKKIEMQELLDDGSISKKSLGFKINTTKIKNGILLPKYYDPKIERVLKILETTHETKSVGELLEQGSISISTGDEIGKMSYGTGDIPFLRTSDIFNWEPKTDPKQGISEEIYNEYRDKQDVRAGDILLVRDGTYLVGSTCFITKNDQKMLYSGGIYKIRTNANNLDPYLLFGIFNTKIVQSQIRSKQFTRDVIDTLGRRLYEIILPIPKDTSIKNDIANKIKSLISEKDELRKEQREIREKVQFLS